MIFFLFLAVPAIGAELVRVNARGGEHIVESEIAERREAELFTDLFDHFFVFRAVGIRVFEEHCLIRLFALKLKDHAARDELHFRGGTGEIQIFAAIHDRRTACADVYFLGAAVIEELRRFTELCAAHDGVVDEKKLLAVDEIVDRDELHFRDQIALVLMRGHKGTGPSGGIFDERSCVFQVGFVCVTDRVCEAGVGNARNDIGINEILVTFCKTLTAAITHLFDTRALVRGGRIAVIYPKERTDLHVGVFGRIKCMHAFFVHNDDLAGGECSVIRVSEVEISEAFKACAVTVFLFAEVDRCSALFIADGVDALGGEDQHAHRAVDDLLRIADAVDEVFFLVDDRGNKLRLVDDAVLHFKKVRVVFKDFACDFFGVIDLADRCDAEGAVMRTDQNGLRFVVGDTADAVLSLHFRGFLLEFGSERCVFDVVDGFIKSVFFAVNRHTCTSGAEVRMIVYTVKQIKYTIFS